MFAAFTAADLIEPREARDQVQFRRAVRPASGCTRSTRRSWPSSMPKPCTSSIGPGFLQGAFLVASSLGNVQRLIEMKGRRRQRQAADGVVDHHAFPEMGAVGDEFLVDRVVLVDLLAGACRRRTGSPTRCSCCRRRRASRCWPARRSARRAPFRFSRACAGLRATAPDLPSTPDSSARRTRGEPASG